MKRQDRLGMRVKPADKEAWRAAAKEAGMSLSAWIEMTLNAAEQQSAIRQANKRAVDAGIL